MVELKLWLGKLLKLMRQFGSDQCAAWAASISFFVVLSIVPVILCCLAALGFLIHDPHEASVRAYQLMTNLMPDQTTARLLIKQLNVEKSAEILIQSRGIAGVIGIVSLLWAALQIFVNAVAPMNAALDTKETRNWLTLRLVALTLLLISGALVLLSILFSAGMQLLGHGIYELSEPFPALAAAFLYLISIAINGVMFTAIYRYLPSPSANVSWREALRSGIIISVLWAAAKEAFGFYLKHFANYGKVYGSLGGLIALLLWIYYSALILLLGAEIANVYKSPRPEDTAKAAQVPQKDAK